MGTKLYVGNLSYQTTEEQLRKLFESFGDIASVALPPDRVTGRPRGFGFVDFSKAEDAQNAISAMNDKEVDGRKLRVNPAEDKKAGGGGGGGGRGGNGGGGGGRRGGAGGGGGRDRW